MIARAVTALAFAIACTPVLLHSQAAPPAPADLTAIRCDGCPEWNRPQQPFRVHGNTWYVGTGGLSAVLVTSPEGHVLIDGALPESAPLIAASIRALGFRLEDVKLILNSHAHFDHAGGIAALERASGATVAAQPWSAAVMRSGRSRPEDPQHGVLLPYPSVSTVREITDGETVRVGPLALTAHFTGGHTPGGTTWSWRSCEADRCWDIVYADSQTPISADGFLYSRSTSYPSAVADFERGHAVVEQLACDVLLTPHPAVSGLFERLARREAGDAEAFRDPSACRDLAASSRQRLAERLAKERGGR